MPGLTISTDSAASRPNARADNPPASQSQPHSRSTSPTRPPVSPITPTLGPAQPSGSHSGSAINSRDSAQTVSFAQNRQTFTHSQPDQVAVLPPPPEPISFDQNPDVLALKSAISILQLQRQKAIADIQQLSQAKREAIDNPAGFLRDLSAGMVGHQADLLFVPAAEDQEDEDGGPKPSAESGLGSEAKDKAWAALPTPQNVVRCPPINWSQYAIVGESLDKLHTEQLTRPTQGSPAVMGPGGTFEFKAELREGDQRRLVGIAAPYTPGRDKLDKKPKGPKR